MSDRQISLKAAIDALDGFILDETTNLRGDSVREILEALPSAQSERSSEIQDILEYLNTVLHPIISPDHWNVYSELHDMISMLPSAQPEIIMCKDCKYSDENWRRVSIKWLPCMDVRTGSNCFCGSAERREDGKTN